MKKVSRVLVLASITTMFASCGKSSKQSQLEASSSTGKIILKSDDAKSLLSAMQLLGVTNTDPRSFGALVLKAQDVRCEHDDTVLYSCNLEAVVEGKAKPISANTGDGAKLMFDSLKKIGATVNGGANPFMRATGVKEITCSQPVIPNPQATCQVTLLGAVPKPTPSPRAQVITGSNASDLMSAMQRIGVTQADPGLMGALTLKARNVRCEHDDTVLYSCKVEPMIRDQVQPVISNTDDAAKLMYEALNKIGAKINGGINPLIRATGVSLISCSQPVIPNPKATCHITLY